MLHMFVAIYRQPKRGATVCKDAFARRKKGGTNSYLLKRSRMRFRSVPVTRLAFSKSIDFHFLFVPKCLNHFRFNDFRVKTTHKFNSSFFFHFHLFCFVGLLRILSALCVRHGKVLIVLPHYVSIIFWRS